MNYRSFTLQMPSDFSFVVKKLSQFMQHPPAHGFFVLFFDSTIQLKAFSDLDQNLVKHLVPQPLDLSFSLEPH